ncbi:MAG TPA: hypothetical protein VN179_05145 [Solirubrobacterales bacterium]|nr:hypothetical protein [Solirubrobacterales bacterium]
MEPKLSVGETINKAFSIYRDQAAVLLPVAFWLFLVVAVIEELAAESVAVGLVGVVVGLVANTLYQGMVVGLVSDVQDGRRDSSVGELMRSVLPVLWPLIGAGILAALGIAGGFILLVVPGLYLLTIWAVIAPVIVVERRRVFDAFGRSRHLVKGHGWAVFGTVLLAFLIVALAGIAFAVIAAALSEGVVTRIVFGTLASTLTAPVAALVAAVLYFRLRAIHGEQQQPAAEGLVAPEAPEAPEPPR